MIRATVVDVIERRRPAHDLRDDLAMLWRDGFRAGAERTRERLAPLLERAESDADYWYLRARHTDAEIDEMQQRAIDNAFESGDARWLDHSDQQASWADARQGAHHG